MLHNTSKICAQINKYLLHSTPLVHHDLVWALVAHLLSSREFVTAISQHASAEERTIYPMINAKVAHDDGSKVGAMLCNLLGSHALLLQG